EASSNTSGTVSFLYAVNGGVLANAGTVNLAASFSAGAGGFFETANGTINNYIGYYASNSQAQNNIGTMHGVFVEPLTAATNNYGVTIGAASTQTLWVGNDDDHTTASAGIAFGESRDTNLYRSAANTLKTDDSLVVAGNASIFQSAVDSTTAL